MPRKAKGIHTSPEKAGEQNMPDGYIEKNQDELGTMEKIMPVWKKSFENRENYKGKWTEETLAREIGNYFQYCADNKLKPAKVGLALWLGTHKQQIWEWETKPEKYGFKSELIQWACYVIESSYIERGEKYPTMNTFLLRTSHGHVETSKMDVTTNNQVNTSAEEVKDLVKQLGLNKPNS